MNQPHSTSIIAKRQGKKKQKNTNFKVLKYKIDDGQEGEES